MATVFDDDLKFQQTSEKKAFIVGYTGESGKELVKELARTKIFQQVRLLGRRNIQLALDVGNGFEQMLVNFDELEKNADCFKDVDVGFCCLGTTRKKAGKDGFVKVDRDYVLKTAEIAKQNGCKHFSVVTSTGANQNSVFLYPKIKGEVEERLKEMNFEKLSIFRPGLLMCDREESRPGERCCVVMCKPFAFCFPTAGTTPTDILARALLYDVVDTETKQVNVYNNTTIHSMSKRLTL